MSVTLTTSLVVVALGAQEAGEQREDDEGPGVADVDAAVDGRPAGVDADLAAGVERGQLAAQRVLDPNLAHRGSELTASPGGAQKVR